MKKLILLAVILGATSFGAISQVNPHAIGIRGGADTYGSGAEISYQHGLGTANRLELDLGWSGHRNYSSMYIAGIYHWVFNISGGFNWFVGPGAVLGLHSDRYFNNNDGITLGVGGQIGIEYDFNTHGVPLMFGLDTRPMWRFVGYGNGSAGYGGAFSIRFTF